MRDLLAFLALGAGVAGTLVLYVAMAIYERGYRDGRYVGQAESVRRLVRGSFELELDIDESIVVIPQLGVN